MKKLSILNITLLFLLTGCFAQVSATANPTILLTAEELIVAFKNQGLPVSSHKIFTEENDPDQILGKPKSFVSKASFTDPLTHDGQYYLSNSIEVFSNTEDARVRRDLLLSAQSDLMIKKQYLYLHDCYLLCLSNNMSQKDAQRYVETLSMLVDRKAVGPNGGPTGSKFP